LKTNQGSLPLEAFGECVKKLQIHAKLPNFLYVHTVRVFKDFEMTIIVVRFLSGLDIWLPEAYFDH
jgi:hypothetical protein